MVTALARTAAARAPRSIGRGAPIDSRLHNPSRALLEHETSRHTITKSTPYIERMYTVL